MEILDCMCEYGYSCFLGLFFSHVRIGLLVEPGRETEKLIIVPLFPLVALFLAVAV